MTARARPSAWIALAAALGLVLPSPRDCWAEPIPKPSASLLRSLDRFERDLQLLDQTLPNPAPGSVWSYPDSVDRYQGFTVVSVRVAMNCCS